MCHMLPIYMAMQAYLLNQSSEVCAQNLKNRSEKLILVGLFLKDLYV